MAESIYNETVSKISGMSNAELDQELEEAAILNEKTDMLLCCYLSAVSERRAFEDFGYSNVGDYAEARFGFGERKTRYLVALGRKIERLPKLREALASGKLGWCKASRVASVASADNEAMWIQSALSLTVQQLEQRIKDGTDPLVSVLRLPLTESRQNMWEIALETRPSDELTVYQMMLALQRYNPDAFGDENIKRLKSEGKPQDQAVAIALSKKRRSKKKGS